MGKITFSINDYDRDGYVHEYGVFLHFGDTRVKVADNMEGFSLFIERVSSMRGEIEENYPHFSLKE